MKRLDSVKIEGYIFPDYPCLIFHSGKFWIGEHPVKEVYNNGSTKQAVKCIIELNNYPF